MERELAVQVEQAPLNARQKVFLGTIGELLAVTADKITARLQMILGCGPMAIEVPSDLNDFMIGPLLRDMATQHAV